MRAGPLADGKVIDLLNRAFVCVYTSNDEISGDADFVKKETAARRQVLSDFSKANLGTGSVQVYVMAWDRKPLGRLHVAKAAEKNNTLELLEKIIAQENPVPGEPLVKPR